jgi:hypothetical protein
MVRDARFRETWRRLRPSHGRPALRDPDGYPTARASAGAKRSFVEALPRGARLHGAIIGGQCRELQNEIQHLLVMGPEDGALGAELLSRRILRAAREDQAEDVAMLVSRGCEGASNGWNRI